jgi:hypothetical protein
MSRLDSPNEDITDKCRYPSVRKNTLLSKPTLPLPELIGTSVAASVLCLIYTFPIWGQLSIIDFYNYSSGHAVFFVLMIVIYLLVILEIINHIYSEIRS